MVVVVESSSVAVIGRPSWVPPDPPPESAGGALPLCDVPEGAGAELAVVVAVVAVGRVVVVAVGAVVAVLVGGEVVAVVVEEPVERLGLPESEPEPAESEPLESLVSPEPSGDVVVDDFFDFEPFFSDLPFFSEDSVVLSSAVGPGAAAATPPPNDKPATIRKAPARARPLLVRLRRSITKPQAIR